MNFRKPKYIIGLAFLLLGIGIVIATMFSKSIQYYLTVDEMKAKERELIGEEFKVAGKVEAGSVEKNVVSLENRFRVTNGGQVVAVLYKGPLPDTFKEGADVVVTGTLKENGNFEATDVLAKCASKYEGKLTPGYAPRAKEGI